MPWIYVAPALVLLAGLALPLAAQAPSPWPIRFTDVTAASGIAFTHAHGGSGGFLLPETMAGGAAFFDADRDGRIDVLLLQGQPLPARDGSRGTGSKFFRNTGEGRFAEATAASGLDTSGHFAMAAATADYDNDGDTDVFLTTVEGNLLFKNDGRGVFANVTEHAGVRAAAFSTAAAFLDADADGWLDLFVGRYADYDLARDKGCASAQGPMGYCGPGAYSLAANRLFMNNRDGSFRDATGASGIGASKAHALGVAAADYNEDGRMDIFVASDREPNLLFINQGGGVFKEQALAAGVAVGAEGIALAGMGVDAGDFDNDGHVDLVITNYAHETNSLYLGRGDGTFVDRSAPSGVTGISRPYLGWGTRLVDLDGDGFRDLFVANGHVNAFGDDLVPRGNVVNAAGVSQFGFRQPAQVYHNRRDGRVADVSMGAGPYFARRQVSRGAAFADYDNDGDWDVLVVNNNSPAVLLRNDVTPARWTRIVLEGQSCNRDGIGARVQVRTGSLTQTETVRSGTSYLSDHDRRLLFALPGSEPAAAEIRWPCGAIQKLSPGVATTTLVKEQGCLRAAGPAGR